MSGNPWSKFFWSDWETDPALRLCSMGAQGFWMRCLCIAAKSDPTGYVSVNGRPLDGQDLARLTGVSVPEVETWLAELDRNGVFSRDRKGCIYSRRMTRDAKKAAIARKNGKNGGNPTLSKDRENQPSVNPPVKGGDKPQKPEANNQNKDNTSDLFAEWYAAYPVHKARGKAHKAYQAALKKISHADLLAAAFRAREIYRNTDPKFIPHPASWLNAEQWADGEVTNGSGGQIQPQEEPRLKAYSEARQSIRDRPVAKQIMDLMQEGRMDDADKVGAEYLRSRGFSVECAA